MKPKRTRMIVDLPKYVHIAIKLAAIKNDCTTGEVVEQAVRLCFLSDVAEAERIIKEHSDGTNQ